MEIKMEKTFKDFMVEVIKPITTKKEQPKKSQDKKKVNPDVKAMDRIKGEEKPSPETIAWWNSRSYECQQAFKKMHGKCAAWLKAGVLKERKPEIGEKEIRKTQAAGPTDADKKTVIAIAKAAKVHKNDETSTEQNKKLKADVEKVSKDKKKIEKADSDNEMQAEAEVDIELTAEQKKEYIDKHKAKVQKEGLKKDGPESYNFTVDSKGNIIVQDKTVYKVDEKEQAKLKQVTIPKSDFDNLKKDKKMFLEDKEWIPMPKYIKDNTKIPTTQKQLLELLMNAKNTSKYKKITDFIPEGSPLYPGAGQINSQAGELIAMTMIALSDKDAKDLVKYVNEKYSEVRNGYKQGSDEKPPTKKQITDTDKAYQVTRDWFDSGYNVRQAAQYALMEDFPNKNLKLEDAVKYVSWDDLVGMRQKISGIYDYKNSKEKSTDMSMIIDIPGIGKKWWEISLKKSFVAMLLNSGVGALAEKCGTDWPDEIAPETYKNSQKKAYSDGATPEFKKDLLSQINIVKKKMTTGEKLSNVEDGVRSGIKELSGSKKGKEILDKKNNSEDIMNFILTTSNRHTRKAQLAVHKQRADNGDKKSANVVKKVDDLSREYTANVISSMNKEPVKSHVQGILRANIPLKGIMEGHEKLFAGQYTLSEKSVTQALGVDRWTDVEENLVVETDSKTGENYICYKVKGKKGEAKTIKIAAIGIREDGIGYGGDHKFELIFFPHNDKDSLTYLIEQQQGSQLKMQNASKIYVILNKEKVIAEIHTNTTPKNTKLMEWLLKK
jgi:hypothetical protein